MITQLRIKYLKYKIRQCELYSKYLEMQISLVKNNGCYRRGARNYVLAELRWQIAANSGRIELYNKYLDKLDVKLICKWLHRGD